MPTPLIEREEIAPGLVLFLNPNLLIEWGAAYSCPVVPGEHFFVCIEGFDADGDSKWVPCTSKPRSTHVDVPEAKRTGHPGWTRGPCFVAPRLVWVCSFDAIRNAAYTDSSSNGNATGSISRRLCEVRSERER